MGIDLGLSGQSFLPPRPTVADTGTALGPDKAILRVCLGIMAMSVLAHRGSHQRRQASQGHWASRAGAREDRPVDRGRQ